MSKWYERLEEVRLESGFSQSEFADMIGIDQTALSRYEAGNGAKKLTSNLRYKLFSVLNEIQVNYIEYGDDIPKKVISQSGNNNVQSVGHGNNIMRDIVQQVRDEDLAQLDREILSLLEYAPDAFKKKIIEKLKSYKEDADSF